MKKRLIAYLVGIMLLAGSIGGSIGANGSGDPPPICPPSVCLTN